MIQQAGETNMRYAFSKIRETLHKACNLPKKNSPISGGNMRRKPASTIKFITVLYVSRFSS